MRKFLISTTALVLAAAVVAFRPAPEPAVDASAVNGVWKAVHVAFASADTSWANDIENPNILILTNGYWSNTRIRGQGGPRADLPEDPTDEQLLEAWRRFGAAAGTYTVSGSTITSTTLIAKSPNAMSGGDNSASSEYRLEGGKLIRVFENEENGNKWTVTFERLE